MTLCSDPWRYAGSWPVSVVVVSHVCLVVVCPLTSVTKITAIGRTQHGVSLLGQGLGALSG